MFEAWGIAYFKGELDEIRIWNNVRTPEQIRAFMCRQLDNPTSETNLVGYWRFDEGYGQIAHDYSRYNHQGRLGSISAPDDDDPLWLETEWPHGECDQDIPSSRIGNGSFEEGPGISVMGIGPGDTRIVGWTVTRGNVDYMAADFIGAASDGVCLLDLDGWVEGGIAQDITTAIGETYRITFDLAAHLLASSASMRVAAAGQSAQFTVPNRSNGRDWSSIVWSNCVWCFVATSAVTTVEFYSLGGGSCGPLLDNVANKAKDPTVYDVYLGTNRSMPRVATDLTTASYDPQGRLAFDTTYYWQVVASNNSGYDSGPGMVLYHGQRHDPVWLGDLLRGGE